MSLFFPVVMFELKYQFKRISTYVYFGAWFVLAGLLMSLGEGRENAVLNTPATIAQLSVELMTFGIIVVSGICGMAVCRDFEDETYQLLFTTGLRRRDYLLGRLTGALLVTLLIFSGITLGLLVGTVLPWADHDHMAPIRLWTYIQPYLVLIASTVIWAGTTFFVIGALSRRTVVVYLQGVLFLALYLGTSRLMGNTNDFWPALADPFGSAAVGQVTRYWTLAETNTRLLPFEGALLWNRLIWLAVGVVSVAAVLRFFPFSTEALVKRRSTRAAVSDAPRATTNVHLPHVQPAFGWHSTAWSLGSLTWLRVRMILTDRSFVAIAVLTVALNVVSGWGTPRVNDTPVYPVTYLMSGNLGILMAIVITAMYAGELVWKERAVKFAQVHDALPMPTWLNFASQFAALTIIQVIILTVAMATGMAQQVAQGYYRFELDVYFADLFLYQLSSLVLYSVLAIFVQTIVPNKFIGHALVIGVALAPGLLAALMDKWNVTIPSNLYEYADTGDFTYSAMNGYGLFVRPIVWLTWYWGLCAAMLAVATLLFARRGTDGGWRIRWRQARSRAHVPMVGVASACLVSFVTTGAYLYYDARIVDTDFLPRKAREALWARYEKEFKQFEALPQPKITAVDLVVDLVPERAMATATGTYTLFNKSNQPISDIHIVDSSRSLKDLSFDRPFEEIRFDKELRYHVYQLTRPLAPGETMHLRFRAVRERHGFQDTSIDVVANGTFSTGWFPVLGYQREQEIDGEDVRKKHGLPKREDLPPPDQPGARARSLFGQDADWIQFKAIVSTAPDQIAVAPGYLTRTWTDADRRYFEYDMGDTRIQNFYTFVSARYVVKRVPWRGVSIEVYYDPQHPYNVDRMIESAKVGLDYFTANFGPYQFRQFRVLEFPRYESFAQSFANTVPYSEGIGFIFHPTAEEDLDYPLYVTAHELAHQWWGHQVVGAWAQGSNILGEMLAEYSALMVVEHVLGPSGVRTYLKHDLDGYLRGRRSEVRGEQTLARVTRQPYVWYQKGSLVMYALKDYIGEERLNAALRAFLEKNRFQEPPYTTVDDFIDTMRATLPDDRKHLITDFFETITLYDNRAQSATWRETPDHRYAVTLTVSAAKIRADDRGNEQEIAADDLVDIGVFSGTGRNQKALLLEKRRITRRETVFELVVDQQPTHAGIDPYNKLIDRDSDDNVVAVKKRE